MASVFDTRKFRDFLHGESDPRDCLVDKDVMLFVGLVEPLTKPYGIYSELAHRCHDQPVFNSLDQMTIELGRRRFIRRPTTVRAPEYGALAPAGQCLRRAGLFLLSVL